MKDIYTLESNKPGPTISIMGAIHGDEFCGAQAIEEIKDSLQITKGKVHMIIANRPALEQNTRQINFNMNRIFQDNLPPEVKQKYEFARAQEIRGILDQSDMLLDIHSSGPGSQPFIITEANSFKYITNLEFTNVLTGIDAFHPGSTDGYMFNQNKVGICIECGFNQDPNSVRIAKQGIHDFLGTLDMIDLNQPLIQHPKSIYKSAFIYSSQTENFKLTKDFVDFEHVPANSPIATESNQIVEFNQDYHILFARNPENIGDECFLLTTKQ